MIDAAINLGGVILICLIIWWFLLAKPKAKKTTGEAVDILVQDGIYEPALITAKRGQTLTLCFLRKDETPCSEIVIFDKLNINAKLPINQPYIITLQLTERGEYDFTCQMGMYRGKLVVE